MREIPDKLDADVMLASHHGSATANGEAYLQNVSPAHVVVSSETPSWSDDNPDIAALKRIGEEADNVYWTGDREYHGTVTFTLNNEEIDSDEHIDTELDTDSNPPDANSIAERVDELKNDS